MVRRRVLDFLFLLMPTFLILMTALRCSPVPKEVTTTVTFRSLELGVTHGGIMIWGVEPTRFQGIGIKFIDGGQSITIPNGTWDFFAIRWDGPTVFSGTIRCGHTNAQLTGGTRIVSLTLAAGGPCDQPFFSGPNHKLTQQFLPLTLVTCNGLTGISDGTATCDSNLGLGKSYRLGLAAFPPVPLDAPQSPEVDFLAGPCIEASAVGSRTNTAIRFPTGNPGAPAPLPTGIIVYEGASCPATGTQRKFVFPKGLVGGSPNGAITRRDPVTNRTVVYLNDFPPDLTAFTISRPVIDTAPNISLPVNLFYTGGQAPVTLALTGSGSLSGGNFVSPGTAATSTVTITDARGQSGSVAFQTHTPVIDVSFLSSLSGGFSVLRSSAGTAYNASALITNMLVNSPRLDHQLGGTVLGTLVEKSSTNFAIQSEAFQSAPWGVNTVSITANSTASPDTTTTAEEINDNSGGARGDLNQTFFHTTPPPPPPPPTGTKMVFSIFAKKGTSRYMGLYLAEVGYDCAARIFDLEATPPSDNVVSQFCNENSATRKWGSVSLPNGWKRIFVSYTSGNNPSPIAGQVWPAYATSLTSIADNSATGSIYVWGAQLELGTLYPTSYITTTASQVARAVEVLKTATLTGYNVNGGTFYTEWNHRLIEGGEPATVFSIDDGTLDNRFSFERTTTNGMKIQVVKNGIMIEDRPLPSVVFNPGSNRVAMTYKVGNLKAAFNNYTPLLEAFPTNIPTSTSFIHMGSNALGQGQINGHIRRLKYWNIPLAPEVLGPLTAP